MAKKNPRDPRKNANPPAGPWEPSPRFLTWYRLYSEDLRSLQEIADASKPPVTKQSVWDSIQKTGEWISAQEYEKIRSIKVRHTRTLEKIASVCMAKFYEAQVKKTVTESDGQGEDADKTSRVVKTEEVTNDGQWLDRVMKAQAEIRKIWGAESPTKGEIETRHAEEIPELPCSQDFNNRADYLRAAAKAIEAVADASEGK